MDIETRLEELAQAYAAGRLNEAELARLQEEALRVVAGDDDRSRLLESGLSRGGGDPVGSPAAPGALAPGRVIGPPERQMRLVHDLSGRGRLWLVRTVSSSRDSSETADEFRAIKIFLPAGYESGSADPARDERASRADLVGLRSYLAKVRARVELAMKLDHPVIVRIHGWRQGSDGWPFAEMEYVNPRQGRSLAQLLEEQGRNGLSWEAIAKWLRPVAAALDYARREHRFAHQHLDVDTVFVPDQGTVRLLGFGLAAEIREPRSVLFSTGGSGREAAGEGVVESVAAETTFRRDVFALALLIYRLLTGRTVQETQGQPPGAVPRPPGLTDDAWQVLRRGLAYPSELCPTDAGQFIQALDAAQRPAMASGSGRVSPPKWTWGLAVGLALAVGLGIYWFSTPIDRGPEQIRPDDIAGPPSSGEPERRTTTPADEPVEEGIALREAEREIDQRAFEAASRVDTVAAYQLYLQRCPQCGYGKDARAAIQSLEARKKIEALKANFEALASALEEGREERGNEALSRLDALAALTPDDPLIAAGRQRLARSWVKMALTSLNKPDPDEARKWLRKAEAVQPELPELVALNQALQQAEVVEQVKQTDTEAFAAARRTDTRRAYWAYLDRCATGCNHRAEAEAALARLAPAHPVLRDRLNDGSQGPEMVVIPAGEFQMGSPSSEIGRYSDESTHVVRIEKSLAIGKYEVMFHEYDRFATATGKSLPPDHDWGRGRRPVVNVDWKNATAYAEWLSQQTGQRYRLPTEAEWEYAARAGTTTSRYWGDDPNEGCAYANAADLDGKKVFVGWTVMQCHDGQVYTAPVGSYRNNEFGLYDMAGNVLEWTCSIYDKESKAPVQRCQEPGGDQEMVVRGGSWSDEPRNVRSADRHRSRPEFRDYFLGFRLVRELP
jgi:formylglycine-generating enzyme required for sulfatase activity